MAWETHLEFVVPCPSSALAVVIGRNKQVPISEYRYYAAQKLLFTKNKRERKNEHFIRNESNMAQHRHRSHIAKSNYLETAKPKPTQKEINNQKHF